MGYYTAETQERNQISTIRLFGQDVPLQCVLHARQPGHELEQSSLCPLLRDQLGGALPRYLHEVLHTLSWGGSPRVSQDAGRKTTVRENGDDIMI